MNLKKQKNSYLCQSIKFSIKLRTNNAFLRFRFLRFRFQDNT